MYQQAPEKAQQGERVVSTDELTGVQALERKHPGLPMQSGKVERREFEYIRHGTQSFIFSFDVAVGQILATSGGSTRKEEDFANHIRRMVEAHPEVNKWDIVTDNLNIHLSETPGALRGRRIGSGHRLGCQAQEWRAVLQTNPGGFLKRPSASDRFLLHAQSCFLDEPGRDLAEYFSS